LCPHIVGCELLEEARDAVIYGDVQSSMDAQSLHKLLGSLLKMKWRQTIGWIRDESLRCI
jgi:hypothetical protein